MTIMNHLPSLNKTQGYTHSHQQTQWASKFTSHTQHRPIKQKTLYPSHHPTQLHTTSEERRKNLGDIETNKSLLFFANQIPDLHTTHTLVFKITSIGNHRLRLQKPSSTRTNQLKGPRILQTRQQSKFTYHSPLRSLQSQRLRLDNSSICMPKMESTKDRRWIFSIFV